MEKLVRDLNKQDYGNLYLLWGEEDYLRKQYKDKLKKALVKEKDSMNCHYYEGKDIRIEEIIDLAETLPFFSERRVIIIENSGWFQKEGQKNGEAMADYLEKLCKTTCMIFVEAQPDKRLKLYKSINKHGRIAEFKKQEETVLKKWILTMLGKEGKQITGATMEYLLEQLGEDMVYIKMEIEKLLCYCMDRKEITIKDVDEICCKRIQNRIFDMMEAIGNKDQKGALQLYYDLLSLKEPPMRILALMGRQFNLMLQIKEMDKKGYGTQVIAQKTGLPGFVVGKYRKQGGKFKTKELKEALVSCVQSDEDVKTGKINDRMSVEILICMYSA